MAFDIEPDVGSRVAIATGVDRGRTGRQALDRHGLCVAERELFGSIHVHDEVDLGARIPATIQLDFTAEELRSCFDLVRALWHDGFDRDVLIGLTRKLLRDRDLEEADRLRFKRARAKFKHLRYAHALYGADHRSPTGLHFVTATMGRLQDAFRTGRRKTVLREAILLRVLLTAPAARCLRQEADRLTLTSPASFRALLLRDVRSMTKFVTVRSVSGRHLHRVRKVVGRQRSFWDTLRTITPTADRYDLSRSLGNLNGLMGDLHDRLVERSWHDRASYDAAFDLPDDIRDRTVILLRRYLDAVAAS